MTATTHIRPRTSQLLIAFLCTASTFNSYSIFFLIHKIKGRFSGHQTVQYSSIRSNERTHSSTTFSDSSERNICLGESGYFGNDTYDNFSFGDKAYFRDGSRDNLSVGNKNYFHPNSTDNVCLGSNSSINGRNNWAFGSNLNVEGDNGIHLSNNVKVGMSVLVSAVIIIMKLRS